MAEAHPFELRRRVVEAYERGEGSFVTIADKFQVGEASVNRWVTQYRDRSAKPGGSTLYDVME